MKGKYIRTTKTRESLRKAGLKVASEGRLSPGFTTRGIRLSKGWTEKISKSMKLQWKDKTSPFNSKEYRQKQSDRLSNLVQTDSRYAGFRYKKGRVQVGDTNYHYRSGWEVTYAKYLQYLKEKNKIKNWKYENKVFVFEKIKFGTRSYRPDFEITNNNETIEYHEVKGYMDPKSATKIKRMRIYFPEIKLLVIGSEEMKEVKKWEKLFD